PGLCCRPSQAPTSQARNPGEWPASPTGHGKGTLLAGQRVGPDAKKGQLPSLKKVSVAGPAKELFPLRCTGPPRHLAVASARVWSLALSADGRHVLFGSGNRKVAPPSRSLISLASPGGRSARRRMSPPLSRRPPERRFRMEPRNNESQKTPQPRPEERKRRFQIVKLEERIAPSQGGNGTNNSCDYYGCRHYHGGYSNNRQHCFT